MSESNDRPMRPGWIHGTSPDHSIRNGLTMAVHRFEGEWRAKIHGMPLSGRFATESEAQEAAEEALAKQCEDDLRALGRWPYRYRWTHGPIWRLCDTLEAGSYCADVGAIDIDGGHLWWALGCEWTEVATRDEAIKALIAAVGIDARDVAPFPGGDDEPE